MLIFHGGIKNVVVFYPTNQLGPFVKRTKFVVASLPHHPQGQ
jgi:hypothetical protein